MKQFLEIGKIVATRGVRGEVRVQPWSDSPEFLCEFDMLYLDEGKKTIEIERSFVQKNVEMDYSYITTLPDMVIQINKGDSDQDRPNSLL